MQTRRTVTHTTWQAIEYTSNTGRFNSGAGVQLQFELHRE